MSDDDLREPAGRQGDYRAARIGAASALTLVVVVVIVIDALSEHYAVDPVTLVALLTTIGALLGIEVLDSVRRGR